MATNHDVEVLHGRLTELKDMVSSLAAEVRESNALCRVCRPKVLGNGSEGYDTRITRLEETVVADGESRIVALESARDIGAWFVTKMLAVCTIIASVIGAGAHVLIRVMEPSVP